MRSIRTKITFLTVIAILVSVVSVGLISVLATKRAVEESVDTDLGLLCENRAYSINRYLGSVEQSVDMVSRLAIDKLDGTMLRFDAPREETDNYLHGYLKEIETVFHTVANYTEGTVAFYYRINPEFSQDEKGFFYSRIGQENFKITALTVIEDYDPDDETHVAWYYVPMARGAASWLDPYDNENLGIRMVSYVTPLYYGDSFLGVIGMDIDYDTLVSQIRDIRLYDSGYACLMDSDGNIIYHPRQESGGDMEAVESAERAQIERMREEESSERMIRYTLDGVRKYMCFTTLRNGMKLVVCAPTKEINETWLAMSRNILFTAALILIVFAAIAVAVMKRSTKPLQSLTEAAEALSKGNYDVKLEYSGDDEVGVLTGVFRQMAAHLKNYIDDLNSRAYQDAMTGVKNKGAFAVFSAQENACIAESDVPPAFALVMLDCNNLKMINDRFGHEKGDSYLRNACLLICEVFPHSPVFRMGGDEFLVVLQGGAYADRSELLDRFDHETERVNASASQPWERVSIAKGMAEFDPAIDRTVEDVMRRADVLMYEHKRLSKVLDTNL